jgi:hypothetical protein
MGDKFTGTSGSIHPEFNGPGTVEHHLLRRHVNFYRDIFALEIVAFPNHSSHAHHSEMA